KLPAISRFGLYSHERARERFLALAFAAKQKRASQNVPFPKWMVFRSHTCQIGRNEAKNRTHSHTASATTTARQREGRANDLSTETSLVGRPGSSSGPFGRLSRWPLASAT